MAASGRAKDFSRKILVICLYIPPNQLVARTNELWECVADTIEKAQKELNDPYVVVGGDTNRRPLAGALVDFPSIQVISTGPTRGTAVLDEVATNFNAHTQAETFVPLEDEEGNESDHRSIVCRAKIPRLHQFSTKIIEYRIYNEESEAKFGSMLLDQNWDEVRNGSPSDAAIAMDTILQSIYDKAFPKKKRKIKSTDAPWMTDLIRRLIRNRKRYYKLHGRNYVWRRKCKRLKKLIRAAKRKYLEKVKKAVTESHNSRGYFQAAKILSGATNDPTPVWHIQSMYPGLPDIEIAEVSAEFFNGISNQFTPLDPLVGPDDLSAHCPEVYLVAQRLKKMKKPKSVVRGDIDPRLVTKFADLLAVPVHEVFKKVFQHQQWPQLWATETVTLIPKVQSPDSLSQLRNISCTPLFSKCLEGFVLDSLKVNVKLSMNQFGGTKGVGVDHFLVDTWDNIMTGLEDLRACVNLMSIDFKKAFNTMCHKSCLIELKKLGATGPQRALVAAFLRNRVMQVKVGNQLSVPRLVPGGGPSGQCAGQFFILCSY